MYFIKHNNTSPNLLELQAKFGKKSFSNLPNRSIGNKCSFLAESAY